MAAVHHPGVAHVYDYGELGDGTGAYLVMAKQVSKQSTGLAVMHALASPAGLIPGPVNPPASPGPAPGSADPSQRGDTGPTTGASGSPRQPTGTATRPGAGGAASSPLVPPVADRHRGPMAQPAPAPTTNPAPTTTNQ